MLLTDEECDGLMLTIDGTGIWSPWEKHRAIVRAAYRAGLLRAAEVCDSGVINRPDNHVANHYDGGRRTCANDIRAEAWATHPLPVPAVSPAAEGGQREG